MRSASTLALAATLLALATSGALAQADPNKPPLDPSADCPQPTRDLIVDCLAAVYADEGKLPGGPCSSSDWRCVCNVQQGLIDCYKACPGIQPAEDISYNQANCAGQNGVTNAAAGGSLSYSGSPLTTTGAPGSSGGPVPSATTLPASTTFTDPGTTSASSLGVTTRTSASSGGASATSSAAPNAAAAGVFVPGASFASAAAWAVVLSIAVGALAL